MSVSVLADLLEFTRDGEWGKGEPDAGLVEVGIIRGTDFSNVRYGDLSSIPKRYVRSSVVEKKKLRSGDVLIETAGGTKDQLTGRSVFLNESIFRGSERPLLCASFARFLRIREGSADARYIFWKLQDEYIREELLPFHVQHTGVARFQYTQFATTHALELPDSLDEQEEIGSVLSALDDKIELNRRTNETLEALAQAIFKDWFVDFGPTRRKHEGVTDPVAILGGLITDPAKAVALAGLFPDRFGDDGLPEGWEDKGLNEVAEFLNGVALQKFPPTGDDDLPVIKIAELRGGITTKTNLANRSIADKYLIKDGDFLFSWSGSLMAKFWTEGEGALNQHLFKVSSATHPRWFYSQWVHHHLPEFQTIAASKATTMGHIQRGHLSAARVIAPPEPMLGAMTEIIESLVERTIHNDLENRTLAETRDYLLPKLMSGEVRMRNAEKLVE
ncbi:type I restriction enzyme S subunit [Rhodobium orientis]|uniref:Type I restriction modification DNA specificity domain-containing protein n=1 Tax=Rhodobium orientis TaxID=34017 RepID=A0A327JIT5_9HYPH|nr:restriction endonuclease subunit S [Rhodobium orientis]MBB4302127.1 type I restriction enzyme S subunit [Rhodobium orientis]MBK5951287.1 hypothetical protein [Rhodobium orientis]RAI25921.1 hypothetical protein CH339_16425 [Rhodobium orientis]